MSRMPRILIAEDERAMRIALADRLAAEGYRVITASDGMEAFGKATEQPPDIALVDVMMPQLDGFALCSRLRELGHQYPVLMLTAKGQVDDRVRGLDAGADDYLVKPFSTAELLARIRALLRRTLSDGTAPESITLGSIQIDFRKLTARMKKIEIVLTAKEFAMLRMLAEANGEPVSRNDFLDRVWGYASFPTTRTIDNHVANLRHKLEPNPETPVFIKTVHGVGYRLELTKP
jgi:DNA-binding response OmpR family regulator